MKREAGVIDADEHTVLAEAEAARAEAIAVDSFRQHEYATGMIA